MAERIQVVPTNCAGRPPTPRDRQTPEAVPDDHADIMASLDLAGTDLQRAARCRPGTAHQRRACYQQQAAAHATSLTTSTPPFDSNRTPRPPASCAASSTAAGDRTPIPSSTWCTPAGTSCSALPRRLFAQCRPRRESAMDTDAATLAEAVLRTFAVSHLKAVTQIRGEILTPGSRRPGEPCRPKMIPRPRSRRCGPPADGPFGPLTGCPLVRASSGWPLAAVRPDWRRTTLAPAAAGPEPRRVVAAAANQPWLDANRETGPAIPTAVRRGEPGISAAMRSSRSV